MAAARLGSGAQRRAPAPSTTMASDPPPMIPRTRSTVAAAATTPSTSNLSAPARWIQQNLSTDVTREQRLGGSAWASFGEVELRDGRRFFVKTAGRDAAATEMFRGEMLGLNALRDASDASGAGLAVPRVYYGGGGKQPGESAFIVMDYLDLGGGGGGSKRSLQSLLGEGLARMHNAPVPPPPSCPNPRFGFPVDNTIGGTPQRNTWSDDWVEFYREKRLRFQLKLAADAALTQAAAPLLDNLHLMFNDYAPGGALEGQLVPSVLHGDLWSGNYGPSRGGGEGGGGDLRAAIFDPAVYFGHSEAEFGMSWCAGFSQEFYDAYFAVRPRAPGFEKRRDLYTLYHYLNHLNLFGGGYRGECARCLDRLSATIKGGGVPAR